MDRYFAQVEYLGSHYHGFQCQKNTNKTIQYELENALSKVGNEEIKVVCSGRTDAGVHALNQIIHFDTKSKRKIDSWIKGANRFLPEDICLKNIFKVSNEMHARFNAISRTYVYLIQNSLEKPAINSKKALWCSHALDHKKMNSAAKKLIGEKDFSSFRASGCQSHSPIRKITVAEVNRKGKYIIIKVTGNAFMLNMMRIIVGTLLRVGKKEIGIREFEQIIKLKNRKYSGKTVSPNGLYFIGPEYNEIEYKKDELGIL